MDAFETKALNAHVNKSLNLKVWKGLPDGPRKQNENDGRQ